MFCNFAAYKFTYIKVRKISEQSIHLKYSKIIIMSIIKNYQSAKGTCKVTFSYPLSEGVKTVQVLGDFNDWDSNKAPKMKKGKTDLSTTIELAAGKEYSFRYLLNGDNWANDNSADKYISSPFSGIENSVIVIDSVIKKATAAKTTAPKVAKVTAPKTAKTIAPKVAKEVKPATAKAATPKPAKVATPKVTKVAKPTETKEVATPKAVKAAAKPAIAKVAKVAAPKVAKVTAPKVAKATSAKTKKEEVKN
jgi:hypothetical protein